MSLPMDRPRVRVVVLFGGPGHEYDVSCASAASITGHLDRGRFEVTPIRVSRNGVWIVGKDDPGCTGEVDVPALLRMTPDEGPHPHLPERTERADSLVAAVQELSQSDVALPCFHGRYGEDGMAQALLELVGVPYVGNGIAASVAGLDKEWTKTLLRSAGLLTAEGVVLDGVDAELAAPERERLGLPVFVKPAREGSSIGLSRVDDWSQLDAALARARRSDAKVLVEKAIRGREIDIAVLEAPDGQLLCGPALEVRVEPGGVFDYETKYRGRDDVLQVPADLDAQLTALLQQHARRVFRVLGCAGLLRVDFFLEQEGGRVRPVVNEVNTFPGLSSRSQYPRIWQAAGLEFADLLTRLIEGAGAASRPGPGRGFESRP